ncbi:hypothetical protein ACHCAI_004026 [Enterobacter asburiae]
MRFVIRDPKKGSSGSSSAPTAHSGAQTQHVPLIQLLFLPYLVLLPLSVSRRAAAENSASLIPWPCYTSGKFKYDRESDLTGTAIR